MDDDEAEGRLGQSDDTITMQLGRSSQPRAATSDPSALNATTNSGNDFPSPPPPVTINRAPSDDEAFAATPTPQVAAGAATTATAGAPVDAPAHNSGGNISMAGNSISGDNSSLTGNSFTVTGGITSSSFTGVTAFGLHSPTPPLSQTTSYQTGTGGSLPFGVDQPLLSGPPTPGPGLLTPYSPQGYTPTSGLVDAPALDDQAFEEGAKLYVQSLTPDSLALDIQDIIQRRKFPQFWSHRDVSDALDKLQRQFSSAHGIYTPPSSTP